MPEELIPCAFFGGTMDGRLALVHKWKKQVEIPVATFPEFRLDSCKEYFLVPADYYTEVYERGYGDRFHFVGYSI